jgi:hypothetical protein
VLLSHAAWQIGVSTLPATAADLRDERQCLPLERLPAETSRQRRADCQSLGKMAARTSVQLPRELPPGQGAEVVELEMTIEHDGRHLSIWLALTGWGACVAAIAPRPAHPPAAPAG